MSEKTKLILGVDPGHATGIAVIDIIPNRPRIIWQRTVRDYGLVANVLEDVIARKDIRYAVVQTPVPPDGKGKLKFFGGAAKSPASLVIHAYHTGRIVQRIDDCGLAICLEWSQGAQGRGMKMDRDLFFQVFDVDRGNITMSEHARDAAVLASHWHKLAQEWRTK